MKKLIFILFIFLFSNSFGQTNVKNNYTNPYFQGNVIVKDTLGLDNLIRFSDGTTQNTDPDTIHIGNTNLTTTSNRTLSIGSNDLIFTTSGGNVFQIDGLGSNPTRPRSPAHSVC